MKHDLTLLTSVETPYVPRLPFIARTRGGITFDPAKKRWTYREGVKTVSINFDLIHGLSIVLQQSLKAVLLWYVENSSASHMENMFRRMVHFSHFFAQRATSPLNELTSIEVLNYKSSLTADCQWYLGALSGFLKKWHALGIHGVTVDAVSVLKELRTKGNTKGVAVLTMDPIKGPYTNVELEGIQAALNDAYADGTIQEDMYLLAWLFMALGQRSSQYAALKVCDIRAATTKDGDTVYTLKVPRAKQRNGKIRDELKDRLLISQIGLPLHEYAQRVRSKYVGLLEQPGEAPMFPQKQPDELAEGYEYHYTGPALGLAQKAALNSLKVYSERTGDLLHITPVRFRRTFGTRAAEEGHGELVIAELLDQSDTQNVGIYVAAIPEIAARIDSAIAMTLAPLAQAFKGHLIKNEAEATRSGYPASRIVDLRIDRSAKPMGSCGQHSFCEFSAPIACYTCKSFEPWLDGPHKAVLDHLLKKRDQLLSTTDARMADVNNRTILAVAQVIQLCHDTLANGAAANG